MTFLDNEKKELKRRIHNIQHRMYLIKRNYDDWELRLRVAKYQLVKLDEQIKQEQPGKYKRKTKKGWKIVREGTHE